MNSHFHHSVKKVQICLFRFFWSFFTFIETGLIEYLENITYLPYKIIYKTASWKCLEGAYIKKKYSSRRDKFFLFIA